MGTSHDRPSPGWPRWQPEPLHLPVMDNESDGQRDRDERRRRRRRDEDDGDRPGSHVVVIDFA